MSVMTQDYFLSQREIKKILLERGIAPTRRLGQNFLIDRHALEKIVKECNFSSEDIVLEIGPGLGALTGLLLERVKKVVAFEIDAQPVQFLKERFDGEKNFVLIHQDFLGVDLKTVLPPLQAEVRFPGRLKIIGNLPYCVSTQILFALLNCSVKPDLMAFSFQWEVAERLLAGPGSKDYGSLTLITQYFAEVRKLLRIKKNCFYPQPEVDTGFVSFQFRDAGFGLNSIDEERLFRLIRASFATRRKTLRNALMNNQEMHYSDEEIEEALLTCGLNAKVRAENLTLKDFVRLLRELTL